MNDEAGAQSQGPGVSNRSVILRIDQLDSSLSHRGKASDKKLDQIQAAVTANPDSGVKAAIDALGARLDAIESRLDSLGEVLTSLGEWFAGVEETCNEVLANQQAFFHAVGALGPADPQLQKNIDDIRAAVDQLKSAQARDTLPETP